MSTCGKIIFVLACVAMAGSVGASRAVAREADVSSLTVSQLAAIVADPVKQRKEQMLVEHAISALGDKGGEPAIRVLVDDIAYPRILSPLPPGAEPSATPFLLATMHTMGRGVLLSDAFPAVKALMKIGEACVPAVLGKLAAARSKTETNACLDLLAEIKEPAEVQALVQRELAAASSIGSRRQLQFAVDMLPNIDRQSIVHTSPRSAEMGQIRVLEGKAMADPPIAIVVSGHRLSRAGIISDSVLMVFASELAESLGLGVKGDGLDALTLSSAGISAHSLSFTNKSKVALADGTIADLPAAAMLWDEGLMVPLSATAEFFGASVDWVPGSRTAYVRSPNRI